MKADKPILACFLIALTLSAGLCGCSAPASSSGSATAEAISSEPAALSSRPAPSSQVPEEKSEASSLPASSVPTAESLPAPESTVHGPVTLFGETVQFIYALDFDRHTTVSCPLSLFSGGNLELLPEPGDDNTDEAERAFIFFTNGGRYYFYLPDDSPLREVWESIYDAPGSRKNIHWLTHMTTGKISKVVFSDSNGTAAVTNPQELAQVSVFLKNNVTVDDTKEIKAADGPENPDATPDLYRVQLFFDSGVTYTLMGYGDHGTVDPGGSRLSIHTSDLNRRISYPLTEGCAARIRNFFEDFL